MPPDIPAPLSVLRRPILRSFAAILSTVRISGPCIRLSSLPGHKDVQGQPWACSHGLFGCCSSPPGRCCA